MKINQIKMYYGSNINIENYQQFSGIELAVPHCLEKEFTHKAEFKQVFYELPVIEEYRDKVLYFNGASYKVEIYFKSILIYSHEGVWDQFGIQIDPDYIGEKLVIKLIRYDFEQDSDYHFRKTLMGFVPDIAMPFSGIYKDLEVINDCLEKEINYKTNKNTIILDDPTIKVDIKDTEYQQTGELIVIANANYWSPDNPHYYQVTFKKEGIEITEDVCLIDLKTTDNNVTISDQKYYMKGILHWGYYPENIIPVMDEATAEKEIIKIKAAGFNTIKLCLFIAPDYYYKLCIKHGIVIWQEFPLWLPPNSKLVMERIKNEFPKYINMLKKYSNITHLSIGCELEGTVPQELLTDLYSLVKSQFPTKLVCDNSGSNECFSGSSESSTDFYDYHFYGELDNFSNLINQFTGEYRGDKPWYFGEFCDADTWRDNSQYTDQWWTSSNPEVNLLHQVHAGFASGSNLKDQERLVLPEPVSNQQLTTLSLQQAFEFRKSIFELLRQNEQISGYNITTIRDVAITTSGIFDDDMNLKYPQLSELIADQTTIVLPPLRRKWIGGGDIYHQADLHNVIAGDVFEARLLYSNLALYPIESTITIYLNGQQINQYQLSTSKFLSQISDLSITDYKLGENLLEIVTTNQNRTAKNSHRFNVIEQETLPVAITSDLTYTNQEQIILYVINQPNQQYDVVAGPFYREAIVYSQLQTISTKFGNISKSVFGNIAPRYFSKLDSNNIIPLISRVDARKFTVGHYLWKEQNNYYTTFDLLADDNHLDKDKAAIKQRLLKLIMEDYDDSRS